MRCARESIDSNLTSSDADPCDFSLVACQFLMVCPSAPHQVLAIMISCLVHDIDHPGVNSDYLIKSGSSLALQFPYKNVLEQSNAILAAVACINRVGLPGGGVVPLVIGLENGKAHDVEVAREMASASLLHATLPA